MKQPGSENISKQGKNMPAKLYTIHRENIMAKRTETEIMKEIVNIYDNLVPEVLGRNGLADNNEIKERSNKLFSRLDECEKELGRRVDYEDAEQWYKTEMISTKN